MATASSLVESIPLHTDQTGTIRIVGTRIPLDVLALVFQLGSTPEQIVEQFPSLKLPDVYAVITWMLRHPDEIAKYLDRRGKEEAELRAEIEQLCPQTDLRARLLLRRDAMAKG